MKDQHFQEIVIGALLHDIGKVVQRSRDDPARARHQEFGKGWFDDLPQDTKDYLGHGVSDYILRHHLLSKADPKCDLLDASVPGRGDLLLVCEADNLSAGERKEDPDEEGKDLTFDLSLPLYSIFNKIELLSGLQQRGFKAYPAYDLYCEEIPFPALPSNLSPADYGRLLQSFQEGLGQRTSDPVQHLLNLLEAHFSFVPSETAYKEGDPRTYPDVSLFDHLKVTAAVASCLYHFFRSQGKAPGDLSWEEIADRTEPRYLLVAGDFSGVQDFIYTVSYRAALRGLRARSFYVELLLEHIARSLLQALNLSRANLLFCGGGNLYLVAPNTEETKETLKRRRKEFNHFLLEEHNGKLFFAMAWVELNGDSFLGKSTDSCPSVGEAWEEVRLLLEEEKGRRFHDLLNPSFFEPQGRGNLCDICQKVTERFHQETDPETGEGFLICPVCRSFAEAGRKLPKTEFIEISPQREPGALIIEDKTYRLLEKPSGAFTEALYSVNSFSAEAIPLWVGNYPRKGLDFSQVVEKCIGLPSLGTFRADVDNLGTIFSRGLRLEARTLSRMATLSRLLTLFFKRYVNQIAEGSLPQDLAFHPMGQRERELVVVYSGGDDLFVTGAWNDVVEFAIELRRAFKRFVGENPDVTLSGGMVITPAKFPIYRMAQKAEEAEGRAKDNAKDGRSKDSACLFGEVMFWDEWEEAIGKVLEPLLQIGKLSERGFKSAFPRGLIYKILALAHEAEEKKRHTHPYFVLPLLAYVLARSKPDSKYDTPWKEFVKGPYSIDLKEGLHWLSSARGVLRWLDYTMRGGD